MKHTAHICCLRKDGKPVAIGRMLWDHGYTAYVSDVIVKPEFQAQGLGRIVMEDTAANLLANPSVQITDCGFYVIGIELEAHQ